MSTALVVAAMMSTLASAPENVTETEARIAEYQSAQDVTTVTESRQQRESRVLPPSTITVPNNVTQQNTVPSTQDQTTTVTVSPDSVTVTDDASTVSEPGTIPGVSLELERRFDRLAECESTSNWSINTGNGFYGGLQFHPQTWTSFGGDQYAPYAHQATREQQMEIAAKVLEVQGWGAWPACTASFGWR